MHLGDWMSSRSAFYLLLLFEYQVAAPSAPTALSDVFVCADYVLYKCNIV